MNYVLEYPVRPWTTNKDRTMHHHVRAKLIKEWRTDFALLALEAKIPRLEKIGVIATPVMPDRRFQDTAACNPAVKAAIDGIVDAGVIPDDTPEYLGFIKFKPCIIRPKKPALILEIAPLVLCDKCGAWKMVYNEENKCCGGDS